VTLSAQSDAALGDEDERARLLSAAAVILLFRTPLPAGLAALAGTERVAEGAWQADGDELTGRATYTARARARVDQDQVRQLRTGEAELIVRGLSSRVRIVRTDADKLSARMARVRPPGPIVEGRSQPRPLGAAAGNPAPSDGPAGLGDGREIALQAPSRQELATRPAAPAADLDWPGPGGLRRRRPPQVGVVGPPDAQNSDQEA